MAQLFINFTGERYLQFLRTEAILVLTNMFSNTKDLNLPVDGIWLQQDGAPLHYARELVDENQ